MSILEWVQENIDLTQGDLLSFVQIGLVMFIALEFISVFFSAIFTLFKK